MIKPREYWVVDYPKKRLLTYKEEPFGAEKTGGYIHVIEHSAYEQLQYKVKELEAEIADYREALEFYGDIRVNYYMRNDSFDKNNEPDGFVNWTDREVDRGAKAREVLNKHQKPKSEGG